MGRERQPGSCAADPLEGVFREHHASLRRYALRRVGEHAADDVVQAVFVVAWRRREEIPEEVLPWLYGVAWHEVLKAKASAGRLERLRGRLTAIRSEQRVPDMQDVVADAAWAQEFLSTLSPTDSELLRLVAWEDLDVTTAAHIVGLKPGTAHVRLHRLRRRVTARLGNQAPAPSTPAGRRGANSDE